MTPNATVYRYPQELTRAELNRQPETARLLRRLETAAAHDGASWILVADEALLGYALLTPVPGLSDLRDVDVWVAAAQRRRGYGSRLLQAALAHARAHACRQVTHRVLDREGAAASFLRHNGFFLEHEEWLLERPELSSLPAMATPAGATVRSYDRATAVTRFCRLYERCFSGLPWYQPFTPEEAAEALVQAADLLFLQLDGRLAGFAWIQLEGRRGVIEPFAIAPEVRGRGYGRFLLVSALQRLAARGASRAEIGAWRSNEAALGLYQSLGFHHTQTFYYLACDL